MSGMKFDVFRKDLLPAIQPLRLLCTGKSAVPVLSNVYVRVEGNVAEFRATDGDAELVTHCSVEAKENGGTTLPAAQLITIFRDLGSDKATVATDANENTTITAGRSRYRIGGTDTAMFPKRVSHDESGAVVKVNGGVLKMAMKAAACAALTDASRPQLCSVHVAPKADGLVCVGTDSRRLAMAEASCNPGNAGAADGWTVPLSAAKLLCLLLGDEDDVEARFEKRRAWFSWGEPGSFSRVELATKLMEGKYPNWRQVMPTGKRDEMKANRLELATAVKRVSSVVRNGSESWVDLEVNGETMTVRTSSDSSEASESLDVRREGTGKLAVRLNPAFLLDPLKIIFLDDVTVTTEAKGASGGPVTLESAAIGFKYVLMPIRRQ